MLFLTADESAQWIELGGRVVSGEQGIEECLQQLRSNFAPIFCFYAGVLLFSSGQPEKGLETFSKGALIEEDGLFSNAFIASFLKRYHLKMEMPAVCFADPLPFIHFSTTPALSDARNKFVKFFCHTLPDYVKPFSLIDIGTGNGALTEMIIAELQKKGKINEIDEILLIDSSPAMLELAVKTLSGTVPAEKIRTLNGRIQDVTGEITRKYDVAFSSLAYHHMPYEIKRENLIHLKPLMDNFIIFEIHSDNDMPELNSPELIMGVYQSYGRIIDFIYAHDTDLETAQNAVDNFLMTEEISFLTQPRGQRSDYHMLREQWQQLCNEVLLPDFQCLGNTDCYADEYISLIALHYGMNNQG